MKAKTRQFADHPDRDEILRAVGTGEVPFRQHLAGCGLCRDVHDFLFLSRYLKPLDVSAPSPDSCHRHSALPLVVSNWLPYRTKIGKATQDSWTGLPMTVTRDSAMGLERSLRFESGAISLELVADRTPDGWRFAARCYRGSVAAGEFILKVGKRRLSPGLHNCYSWFSQKPPRTVQLLSPSMRLVFEVGVW